jgi:glutathione synthase/RimK-type ligase-like ATP-grasp enzyme
MKVAVLTCRQLPSFVTWEIPDAPALFADDRQLIAAFAAQEIEAVSVVWSDERVDWNQFDLALLRSTWDYIDARERFLSALGAIEASSCRLFNPLDAVRWNSDKSYLFDLAAWGVPIVPTLAASAVEATAIQEAVIARGWRRAVLKPRVGTGAADVRLVAAHGIAAALGQLAVQRPRQAFLLQPLIESVISEGEWSFIFIDGRFSHALLKKPAPGDYRAHGIYDGTVAYAEPSRDDRLQAEAMLARLPFDLLYARLDLVRVEGRLAVMELELIEPMLYFDQAPASAGWLARAAGARVGRTR